MSRRGLFVIGDPGEAGALFSMLRSDIARGLPGQASDTLDALAVLGVQHAAAIEGLRLVALGPSEVDIGAAMDVVAATLEVPHVRISLATVVGHGWSGTDVGQALGDALSLQVGASHRVVVTLSDMESLRVESGAYSGVSGTSRRWGQDLAASVGVILAGNRVGDTNTRGLLIALTGECPELPSNPSLGDWTDWGIPHVAARHLATASIVRLDAPEGDALALALIDALGPEHETYRRLGYTLDIDPATLTYAARRLAEADWGGMAVAVGWLQASVRAGLARLLREGAPARSRYTLSPDALDIPEPPKGRYVE